MIYKISQFKLKQTLSTTCISTMESLVFLTPDFSSKTTSSHHVPTLPLVLTCHKTMA